jgi:putative ABC transport system permease protein
MFLRILRDSFFRQKRRKAIVLTAVTLGTAAAAALADIALDIGDKVGAELKSFGANLALLPKGGGAPVVVGGEDVTGLRLPAYLRAEDMPKVKDNFWKNNILAYSPVLDVPAQAGARTALLRGVWIERPIDPSGDGEADAKTAVPTSASLTGVRALNPYWSVKGRWPDDRTAASREAARDEALVGRDLAEALRVAPGDRFDVIVSGRRASLLVAGILTAGDAEDGAVVVPIETAWRLSGAEGRVSRVSLRALTTPESAVYERLGADPRKLPAKEFEKWICTPFVSSIAYELERAVPGSEARVVRRIADSEGNVLRRISGLMALVAVMAVLASALTVTSALTTGVLERRSEIGLLKAMGAGSPRVVALFVSEAVMVGALGGLIGAVLGALLARVISSSVFGAPVAIRPLSVPLAVAAALLITCAGCIVPVRRILRFRPMEVLRGL